MSVASSDIKNNPLLNPLLLAEKFTDQRLFHNADATIKVLSLNDIQPGESLLDLGCGKNTLCRKLRETGIHAVGLDVASIDNGQQPDMIGTSDKIDVPNNSFDHVVSFWGGWPTQSKI